MPYNVQYQTTDPEGKPQWVNAAQFIHEYDAESYANNMRNHLKDVRVVSSERCVGGACGQ